jgi:hypothetical protein
MKERITNMTKVEAVKEFSQAIATNMLGFDPVGSVKKYAKIYKGETIATGAPTKCEDCGHVLKPEVLHSNAGCYAGTEYYIGTQCYCGPYSRESGYYRTYKQAELDLVSGEYYLQ